MQCSENESKTNKITLHLFCELQPTHHKIFYADPVSGLAKSREKRKEK